MGGMRTLREKFDKMVSEPLKKAGSSRMNQVNLTFSAGVVIAHIKTPLSEVLNWARKMEHEAKEFWDGTKDAFSIAAKTFRRDCKNSFQMEIQ